jgi:hypothetical protein
VCGVAKKNMEKMMNISLKFDCREYKDGVKRENRKMIPDGSKISAFAVVDKEQLPSAMPLHNTFCKAILDENGAETGKYFLKFKINPVSKYFVTQVASGKKISFPGNDKIDGRRFICNIIFNIVEGEEDTKEARGNYVNVVQFIREDINIFGMIEGDEYDDNIFDSPLSTSEDAKDSDGEDDDSEIDLIF